MNAIINEHQPEPVRRLARSYLRMSGFAAFLVVIITALVVINVRTNEARDESDQARRTSATALAKAESAISESNANSIEAKHIAECINNLLGQRAPLTNADTNAEVDIFTRLLGVLDASPKDQAKLYAEFLVETRKDVAVLQKDKRIRIEKPLGEC